MRTKVDERLFRAVKTMIKGGANCKEVREYLEIGDATYYRIKSSETYEEYKNQVAAIALSMKKEQKKEQKKEITPEPVKQLNYMPWATQQELMKLLKEQNEMLKLISNKMAFIVEQLA